MCLEGGAMGQGGDSAELGWAGGCLGPSGPRLWWWEGSGRAGVARDRTGSQAGAAGPEPAHPPGHGSEKRDPGSRGRGLAGPCGGGAGALPELQLVPAGDAPGPAPEQVLAPPGTAARAWCWDSRKGTPHLPRRRLWPRSCASRSRKASSQGRGRSRHSREAPHAQRRA